MSMGRVIRLPGDAPAWGFRGAGRINHQAEMEPMPVLLIIPKKKKGANYGTRNFVVVIGRAYPGHYHIASDIPSLTLGLR
jgi:hypothetical protein